VSARILRPSQIGGIFVVVFSICAGAGLLAQSETSIRNVVSKNGTAIAVECAGTGPSLMIVHGGMGDRSRWKPLFPSFASHFTVCAMDRRGRGASGDSVDYSLQKGAEDVAAVVRSRPGTVFVLAHSIGGVCALEAALLTDKISKLVLYEPPLRDRNHAAVATKMENMIRAGESEQALVTFLQEIVMISPSDLARMEAQPAWPHRVADVGKQIREIRALDAYHFDAKRVSGLKIPTLLLTGSQTASPDLKRAISSLMDCLPNRSLIVFEAQEHNAMDTIPQEFAETVTRFLLDTKSKTD
jgi:pimeloyl-ACP methyl ester carboxylesterase